ncbi:hypothetical protein FOA43_000895 [Brettanomyces nanus]|uniref:THO complex subunit 2 n=1 Tax=Eeniella nana TaxID=13502 RepID=A0A875RYA4_EENNA|nr:uncharacterized protein FOA43_000895 [Brettanomyces nanus]QPG73583.1 hypothetical protein FOA43_000895 [Brettanomyces nanus]
MSVESHAMVPFNWNYLTEDSIKDMASTQQELVDKIGKDKSLLDDVFYEIVLSLTERAEEISSDTLVELTDAILAGFVNVGEKIEASIEFLLIFQAINPSEKLIPFIEAVNISSELKNEYLDPSVLRHSLFPDYNRLYYLDARISNYGLEVYSSLGESSEGYSKFIAEAASFFHEYGDVDGLPLLTKNLDVLIGHFKLDMNRCFLLLLSIMGTSVTEKLALVDSAIDRISFWHADETNTAIQSTLVSYLSDATKITPGEMAVIALLVKKNIIDFDIIFNSLSPRDFTLDANYVLITKDNSVLKILHKKFNEELQEEALKSTASALAMAAPLIKDEDDDGERRISSHRVVSETAVTKASLSYTPSKSSVKEDLEQMPKIRFFSYALKYRMYENSIFILTQYPFLPEINDRISDLINEFMEFLLDPYYMKLTKSVKNTRLLGHTDCDPLITDTASLFRVCNELVKFNGIKIARSPILLMKLTRIMSQSLANHEDKDLWLQFYRRFIFPALNFVNNMASVNEIFSAVKGYFPIQARYNLYGEYQVVTAKNNPILKLNYGRTTKRMKDLLKRLSTENLSTSMRKFTKIVYSNPLAATDAFVSHIESYNSLTDLVVDSSRMLNDYSWEVLTYQILNKLTGSRTAVQEDGLNYSSWFLNLSEFIGRLAQKYPESFQLEPILTLIVKSMNGGFTETALIFKEIVQSMTGIKQINNLNSRQILMLNSEESIKKLAYDVIEDRRFKQHTTGKMLINLLVSSDFLNEMFILLCNLPTKIIEESHAPLKILNRKCDEIYSLVQTFIAAIDENINSKVFTHYMLSMEVLIGDYHVEPAWAFRIWRRHWSRAIKLQQICGDEVVVMSEFNRSLPKLLPHIKWDMISPQFYSTFWQLSLYEIDFPRISYSNQLADVKTRIAADRRKLSNKRELNKKEEKRLNDEVQLLQEVIGQVDDDASKHERNFELVKKRLTGEKDLWFTDIDESNAEERIKQILEYCILPRMIHSSFDASFVAEFIFTIHRMCTRGYSLMSLLDKLFTGGFLGTMLFTSTSTETENIAIFYEEVLSKVNEYRKSKEKYESLHVKNENEMDVDEDKNGFEEFRKTLFKWHSKLLEDLISTLDSNHYTARNNGIIFAKGLLSSFPVIEEQGEILKEKMSLIAMTETREDIKLSCNALYGLVVSKQHQMIPSWEFYAMDETMKQDLMKKKHERLEAEKQKHEEENKTRREKERKEEEELRAKRAIEAKESIERAKKDAEKSLVKPYGLVGLAPRKTETKAVSAVSARASTPSGPSSRSSTPHLLVPKSATPPKGPTPVSATDEATAADVPIAASITKAKPSSSVITPSKTAANPGSISHEPPRGPSMKATDNSRELLRSRIEEEKRINRMRSAKMIPREPRGTRSNRMQKSPLPPPSIPPVKRDEQAPLPPPPMPPPLSMQPLGPRESRERDRQYRDRHDHHDRRDYHDHRDYRDQSSRKRASTDDDIDDRTKRARYSRR